MLCLTRKKNESIRLFLPDGRTIDVTIGDIDRNKTRLLFDAPRDIRIMRTELLEPPGADEIPPAA